MSTITTDILVIGGGATGTGIAWDAALRGFRTVLVEKRDLTHGTTGRYHGLLHSGGRYVVKDPESARECIVENRVLRRTHAHCVEDTGGFFVVTPEDEGTDYPDRFQVACREMGIPCEEIALSEALRREPLMNPRISRVFEVPDGAADSFLATHATAQAAHAAGARILIYHEVTDLIVEGGGSGTSWGARRVVGARVRDVATGEDHVIHADVTISAAGAWAGRIAALAGIEVSVIPGKGTLVAMNHRVVNTVLNRCKMPGDGDVIVPIHTVAVIGTTDERVDDPEHLRIEPWEVQLMLDEGDKLVPGISRARVLRAWAGARPLYQAAAAAHTRDVTRSFTLLDHETRDGVAGFLTMTGGKWTTFRMMAEKAVDRAAEKLGSPRPCTTASTPVPGAQQGHYWLGHRLEEVEAERLQGELICECELVTRDMLENAALSNPTLTLDDLRRDVRLGMGPCQGGFCTYRATGILHALGPREPEGVIHAAEEGGRWEVAYMQSPAATHPWRPDGAGSAGESMSTGRANLLLRDFLQERWKGVLPILWGRQLKQERLDELIYLSVLNADHLPDAERSGPLTDFYASDATPADDAEAGNV